MTRRYQELIGLSIHLTGALFWEGHIAPALCWRVKERLLRDATPCSSGRLLEKMEGSWSWGNLGKARGILPTPLTHFLAAPPPFLDDRILVCPEVSFSALLGHSCGFLLLSTLFPLLVLASRRHFSAVDLQVFPAPEASSWNFSRTPHQSTVCLTFPPGRH